MSLSAEDLAEVSVLERESTFLAPQYPRFCARVTWLCALARRLNAPESVQDDRDLALQHASERIVELEKRLNLTPEAVLAIERSELSARDAQKSDDVALSAT
jgi:hypothetical protein